MNRTIIIAVLVVIIVGLSVLLGMGYIKQKGYEEQENLHESQVNILNKEIEGLKSRLADIKPAEVTLEKGQSENTKITVTRGGQRKLKDGTFYNEILLSIEGERALPYLGLECNSKNYADILKTDLRLIPAPHNYSTKFTTIHKGNLRKKTGFTKNLNIVEPGAGSIVIITDTDPGGMECEHTTNIEGRSHVKFVPLKGPSGQTSAVVRVSVPTSRALLKQMQDPANTKYVITQHSKSRLDDGAFEVMLKLAAEGSEPIGRFVVHATSEDAAIQKLELRGDNVSVTGVAKEVNGEAPISVQVLARDMKPEDLEVKLITESDPGAPRFIISRIKYFEEVYE